MDKIQKYKRDYNIGFFTLNNPVYTQIKFFNAAYQLQHLLHGKEQDVNIALENFKGSVKRIRKCWLSPLIFIPTFWKKLDGLSLLEKILDSCHPELSYLVEHEQISDRTIKKLISIHYEKLRCSSLSVNYIDKRSINYFHKHTVNFTENYKVHYFDNHIINNYHDNTVNNTLIFNENVKIDSSYYEKAENVKKRKEYIFLQVKEFLLALPKSKITKKRPHNKICRTFSYLIRTKIVSNQGNSKKNIEYISELLGIEDSISTTTYNLIIKEPYQLAGKENPINAYNFLNDLLAFFNELEFTEAISLLEKDIQLLNNKIFS